MIPGRSAAGCSRGFSKSIQKWLGLMGQNIPVKLDGLIPKMINIIILTITLSIMKPLSANVGGPLVPQFCAITVERDRNGRRGNLLFNGPKCPKVMFVHNMGNYDSMTTVCMIQNCWPSKLDGLKLRKTGNFCRSLGTLFQPSTYKIL